MDDDRLVSIGVETHADVHVAAVSDQAGRLVGTPSFPSTTRSYAQWAESFGIVDKVGMEGAGSFGAGLLRFLLTNAWHQRRCMLRGLDGGCF